MSKWLEGRVAIVTGAGRGIGRATADLLAAEGARVLLSDIDSAPVCSAAAALQAQGLAAHALAGDVSAQDFPQLLVETALRVFGGLDILVNSAGVAGRGAVADLPLVRWHEVIDTNLTGVFYCCRAAIPWLRKRGGGYIFNLSSLAGVNPIPNLSAYNASKFGLNGFSEALMQEIRYDGIKVSTILPGSVDTEFGGRSPGQESWRLAPSDIAEVVLHLLAHDPRSLPSRVEIRPSQPPKKG